MTIHQSKGREFSKDESIVIFLKGQAAAWPAPRWQVNRDIFASCPLLSCYTRRSVELDKVSGIVNNSKRIENFRNPLGEG
jgi:hypothetical protein